MGRIGETLLRHEAKGRRRDRSLNELVRLEVLFPGFAEYLRGGGGLLNDYGRTLPHYAPVHRLLLKYGSGLRGKKLVHIASSLGLYTQFLQSLGVKAIGLDMNTAALNVAKKIGNRRGVRGDAQFLPVRNNALDYVLADHFLLANYGPIRGVEREFFAQIHRVLRPGGILIVSSISKLGLRIYPDVLTGLGFKVLQRPKVYGNMVLQKI